MIFGFHLKVVKQIWIEKSVLNISQKVLTKIDFDNVCITQALSCSFIEIVSIDLVALSAAYIINMQYVNCLLIPWLKGSKLLLCLKYNVI